MNFIQATLPNGQEVFIHKDFIESIVITGNKVQINMLCSPEPITIEKADEAEAFLFAKEVTS